MATFKSEFIDPKKNILIPSLQRDYVQGGREEVISPFLYELCSALKGEKNLDLNYIYGSDENASFVPIDGQQRLITLWLLHLYLYTLQEKDFPVELHFTSREFADSFASKLKEEKEKLKEDEKISDKIVDASWFVSGWRRDTTVQNMLTALDYIAKKCTNPKKYTNFDNITFSFLNMEQEELTDDIYIKMNGRGRPLSYFENLKSWMEEKIVGYFGKDGEFAKEWQQKIDNDWTNFFWQNRDTTQPHPEEIDDEQERFFYNLLRIFWIKQEETFISDDNRNSLYSILDISENNNLKESIISRISKKDGFVLPLFVLEKTGLFSEEFFKWAKQALDGISKYSEQINEIANPEQLEFDLAFKDEQTFCNKIFFSNENRDLAIMSGIIDYCIHCNDTQLDGWLRFIRNIVCNIDNVSNYKNLFLSLEKIATETKNRTSVLDILSTIEPKHYQGIPDEMLQEEKTKATLIQKDEVWKSDIKELENNKYFTGQIKFMFDFLGPSPNKGDFKNYSSLMQSLFSSVDGKYFTIIDEKLFSRALLCFTTSYGYGYQINSNWSFLKSSKTDRNTWKRFISDAKQLNGYGCHHNDCLRELLDTIIKKHTSNLSNETLNTIIESHLIKDWRKFLIDYPGVWDYINQTEKFIRWHSEHHIGLVKSTQYGASVYHAELRSYCLYLDYTTENPSKEKNGWKIWFYEMENTCLVFDKTVGDKQVAIDVRFESENADSEDYYSLEIFLREKERQGSQQYLKTHCDSFSKSERGYKKEKLTKDKVKEEVNKLLKIAFS